MMLRAGARLGPYEILASLGAGGMGEAYRARDAQALARFERESCAVAALSHPNMLTIFFPE